MINNDKVIPFKIEPDLSDEHVMIALRDAIKYSKENKCKSIFILMVPENSTEDTNSFLRSSTRTNENDVLQLIGYCWTGLKIFENYVRGLFGHD